MKNELKNIYRTMGLVVLMTFCGARGHAQTNLTDMLGITNSDYIGQHQGETTHSFTGVRSVLSAVNADLFILTASFTSEDFPPMPVGDKLEVYEFKLNNTLVYEVGVTNTDGYLAWYVNRPTGVSPLGKSVDLDYIIYEDLGVDGDFSFIFTKYFTGIAVDDGATGVKFAPLFFGMESNAKGTFTTHAGEFMGLTNNVSNRGVFMLKTTKSWRMSGNHKIGALDALMRLGTVLDKITNTTGGASDPGARLAGEPLPESELVETFFTGLNVYPNPSDRIFNIDLTLEEAGLVTYQVFDLSGRSLLGSMLTLPKGTGTLEINKDGELVSGTYLIQLVAPGVKETRRIIVE